MKVEFSGSPPPDKGRIITNSLPVLIDTREQLPYGIPGATRATLKEGDYSVEGFEGRVAVERKSLTDFLGCVGGARARFKRELERLAKYEYAALVVEATLSDILTHDTPSQVHPHAAINSLISWSIRYGVQVWLAGDRANGMALTFRALQHFVRIAGEREDIIE